MRSLCTLFALVATICSTLAQPALAQCEPRWLPAIGTSGSNGGVFHLLPWDPDGGGPEPLTLVVGGNFTSIGGVQANRIATWNGVQWSPLGLGASSGQIDAIESHNGQLFASGGFGGAPRIALWNGQTWQHIGTPNDRARALRSHGGLLYAGGQFASISGTTTGRVARWDGVAWASISAGSSGIVNTLESRDGDLLVGGSFSSLGGLTSTGIVAWTGAAWTSFAGGASEVYDIIEYDDQIVVGRSTDQNILSWSGASWASLGGGVLGPVTTMLTFNDRLYVAGSIFQPPPSSPSAMVIRVWDGAAWASLPGTFGGFPWIYALVEFHGEMMVGGGFTTIGGVPLGPLARYTFTNIPWVALHPQPYTTTPTLPVTFSATAATGYDNLTFQWQRETAPGSNQWTNLTDGPGGASPNGGTVLNSTGQINGGQPALLSISNLQLSDAGNYRCIISNPCGQDASDPALLSITNPCRPDLTTTALPGTPGYGTPNGVVNNDDFFFFLSAFSAGNLAIADLTTTALPGSPGYGTPNGILNNDDFFYFLAVFSAGC